LGSDVQIQIQAPAAPISVAEVSDKINDALNSGNIDAALGQINAQVSTLLGSDKCSKVACGRSGVCDSLSGNCVCNAGWTGVQCENPPLGTIAPLKSCPHECTDASQGTCVRKPSECRSDDPYCEAICSCAQGWNGIDCSIDDATKDNTIALVETLVGALISTSDATDASIVNIAQSGKILSGITSGAAGILPADVAQSVADVTVGLVTEALSVPEALSTQTAEDLLDIIDSLAVNDQATTAVAGTSRR
jgi:hypothetical protein